MLARRRRQWTCLITAVAIALHLAFVFSSWSAFPEVLDHVQKTDGHHKHSHMLAGFEANLAALAKADMAFENDMRRLQVAGGRLDAEDEHDDYYWVVNSEKRKGKEDRVTPHPTTSTTTTPTPLTERPTFPGPFNEHFIPPVPGCNKTYGVVVLHWSPLWEQHIIPNGLRELEPCLSECFRVMHTSDQSFQKRADIIEAHDWDGYPPLPARVRSSQLFMFTTLESPIHSSLANQDTMENFNVLQSYRLDSDVRAPYIPIGPKNVPAITKPPFVKFADKVPEAVAAVISNCNSPTNRVQFIEDLSAFIEVHSFGVCRHNRDLPPSDGEPLEILYKYKFVLAIENSLCKDYVTEKLWRAFEWGIIPIVTSHKGHPNYTQFSPVEKAVINVADFPNVEELAKFLKKVAHDEELYNEHIAYHLHGREVMTPTYRHLWDVYEDRNWWCSLGRKILTPSKLKVLAKQRLKEDSSCAPFGVYS